MAIRRRGAAGCGGETCGRGLVLAPGQSPGALMANIADVTAVQARPSLRVLEFKGVRKGTLRGFASVKLPKGLVINDVVIGESYGKQWASLPSKAIIDRDGDLMHDAGGKIRYAPVIEWGTPALREEFSRRVAAIVVRQRPAAFDAAATP